MSAGSAPTTRHLVAAEARDMISELPAMTPSDETLAEFRAAVLSLYPAVDGGRTEHIIPGPGDAPAVRFPPTVRRTMPAGCRRSCTCMAGASSPAHPT